MRISISEAYKILGLPNTATVEDVKSRFRKLAKKTHPDACEESDAASKFQQVRVAYETVMKSLGKPVNSLEYEPSLNASSDHPRRVAADEDPFTVNYVDYWMPKIARMLENMRKQQETRKQV
ncbi:MAG: J domain-containing protein [Candidatus Odinarchaeota archaeon]